MSTLNFNKKLNNKPVGFFDSGVGGLSVYARFKKALPCEDTLYFGDLEHLPYGNKTQEELIGFARKILDFHKSKDVKAVVIACNTSSAQAYDVIKNEYDFPIYPIIQSSAQVIASGNVKRIGVFATQATVDSRVYTRELERYNQTLEVREIACPGWADTVETGKLDDAQNVLDIKKHLDEMLEFSPDIIILGCTHYPYLMRILERFAPKDLFIDPAEIFVEFIKKDLGERALLTEKQAEGKEQIFVSANPENFVQHSKIFYDVKTLPELIRLC